jgi:hypothetical protein
VGKLGIQLVGVCRSAPAGADGNVEFFFHLVRGGEKGAGLDTLEKLVDDALLLGASKVVTGS